MTTKIKTFGGNIGIGTNDPGDFNLNVNGSLKTNSLVVNGVTNAQVPIGLIQLWSGSLGSIPSGWKLCDGTAYARSDGGGNITTPNLTARFIRGATGDAPSPVAVGTTGGSNNASLSVANLPPHSHGVSVSPANANHNHGTTGTTNAPHDHSLAASNTNHSHTAASANANHNHGLSDETAPHSHPSVQTGGAPHSHTANQANIGPHTHRRPDVGSNPSSREPFFASKRVTAWTAAVTAVTSAPGGHFHNFDSTPLQNHSHPMDASNMLHRHEVPGNNTQHSHTADQDNQMPHRHTVGQGAAQHAHTAPDVNAPHGHTANSNNTGQETSFSVLNVYYALFYIMKI
jgi:hypothetical protein